MRLAAAWLAALCLAASPALPHGDAHEEGAPKRARSGGAFAVPEPGSYALPPLGEAADGEVLTSEGRPARLHELFGREVVLLSFIYTRCTDGEGCPLATAVMHSVGSRLAREPRLLPRIRLLSLSFDPERDTPETMRRYGEGFRREGLDWRFLTTSGEASLAPILEAYRQTRVPEKDASGEETGQFAHLLRVFLIDRQGRIRQVYSTSLLEPEALVADVKTLLQESSLAGARPGDGGAGAAGDSLPLRSGDDRSGYERSDYATRSLPLEARRGEKADLLAHATGGILGLPPVPVPDDNPLTADKVELGRRLFFDRRLSANGTFSCAMCHVPEQGFTSNEMATAVGIEGRTVRRNSPTIYNVAYHERLFHDGRASSLEEQIWGPLLAHNEMGNASAEALIDRLRRLDDYAERFEEVFPERGLDRITLGRAIASYERTLVSGDSAFDRHFYGGESEALGPAARRGLALFTGRAGCAACHTIGAEHATFSDGRFHNTGIGAEGRGGGAGGDRDEAAGTLSDTQAVQVAPGTWLDVPRRIVAQVSEAPVRDLGRSEITGEERDRGRYRTPGLRNVALTAPYMHDGSLRSLEAVVEHYRRGGIPNPGLDPRIRPLELSEADVRDLVAFLESLTGSDVETLVADAFAAPVRDIAGGGAVETAGRARPGAPRP